MSNDLWSIYYYYDIITIQQQHYYIIILLLYYIRLLLCYFPQNVALYYTTILNCDSDGISFHGSRLIIIHFLCTFFIMPISIIRKQ